MSDLLRSIEIRHRARYDHESLCCPYSVTSRVKRLGLIALQGREEQENPIYRDLSTRQGSLNVLNRVCYIHHGYKTCHGICIIMYVVRAAELDLSANCRELRWYALFRPSELYGKCNGKL